MFRLTVILLVLIEYSSTGICFKREEIERAIRIDENRLVAESNDINVEKTTPAEPTLKLTEKPRNFINLPLQSNAMMNSFFKKKSRNKKYHIIVTPYKDR